MVVGKTWNAISASESSPDCRVGRKESSAMDPAIGWFLDSARAGVGAVFSHPTPLPTSMADCISLLPWRKRGGSSARRHDGGFPSSIRTSHSATRFAFRNQQLVLALSLSQGLPSSTERSTESIFTSALNDRTKRHCAALHLIPDIITDNYLGRSRPSGAPGPICCGLEITTS